MQQLITRYCGSDIPSDPITPITQTIPTCKGQRWVVPDIHGCLTTLKGLVGQLDLSPHDQLFILGDMIDRGAASRGVVEYLMALRKRCQVYPIRGNHEDDLQLRWELQHRSLIDRYVDREEYPTLFNGDGSIDHTLLRFIRELPFYLELDHCYLVHAGFDFAGGTPFTNTVEMIWTRHWEYDRQKAGSKRIIFGHNPTPLDVITSRLAGGQRKIPLDNGCFFSGSPGFGNLLALNLDSSEMVVQPNIEPLAGYL